MQDEVQQLYQEKRYCWITSLLYALCVWRHRHRLCRTDEERHFVLTAENKCVFNFRLKAWVYVAALISIGSWFQMRGAATEKARSPRYSLVRRVTRSLLPAERFETQPGTQQSFQPAPWGCSSIDGWMDKQAELEFNYLLNWQPMERSECWCHVISWWKAAYKSSSCMHQRSAVVRALMPVAQTLQ